MNTIHFHKLTAIMGVKFKAIGSKNFIIMPIFSIGFTIVMKLVYGSLGTEGGADMSAYLVSLGVLMNICMVGVYCVAAMLAEEKEKHTLRTLMTSSVNGLEFFLGSLIPVVFVMIIVNILLVPIAGFSMQMTEWLLYIGITTLASIIGAVIGMIFGIYAKNQVSASTISMPALLILMMIPMFSGLNTMMERISNLLFTGVVMNVVGLIADGSKNIGGFNRIVLIVEMALSIVLFLFLYKRNGYEAH